MSLTRKEHGIGPDSAWAAGEAFRGEGILPSHAPQGAVLHMPVRRSARLSARGRAECPPPEGPDSEPNHRGINALRDLFHTSLQPAEDAGSPTRREQGQAPRHWEGLKEGRHSAFPRAVRRAGCVCEGKAPCGAREGRMPSLQKKTISMVHQRVARSVPWEGRQNAFPPRLVLLHVPTGFLRCRWRAAGSGAGLPRASSGSSGWAGWREVGTSMGVRAESVAFEHRWRGG